LFHASYGSRVRASRGTHLGLGIVQERTRVDTCTMLWPVAALAVFVFGFVVVYGSVLQSRLDGNREPNESG